MADEVEMEDGEVKGPGEVGQTEQGNAQAPDEKIGLRDISKGLILLAGIILLCYFVLLVVSLVTPVEPGQKIWTLPSFLVSVLGISLILLIVGLVIKRMAINRKNA